MGWLLGCCAGRSWSRATSIHRTTLNPLKKIPGELFNVLTTPLEGEQLQML